MKPARLRVGDSGELVASLHQRLKSLGFKISQAEIERRFFGPATRQAVRSWQIEKELAPYGVVDLGSELWVSEPNASLDRQQLGDRDLLGPGPAGDHPARRVDDAGDR